MGDRLLAKELCDRGFMSGYAEVRRLIAAGAIRVNGETAKQRCVCRWHKR